MSLRVGCAALIVAAMSLTTTRASTVFVGGTTLAETPELAGTILAEQTTPFTVTGESGEPAHTSFAGSLLSRVVREQASGTVTFYFQITDTSIPEGEGGLLDLFLFDVDRELYDLQLGFLSDSGGEPPRDGGSTSFSWREEGGGGPGIVPPGETPLLFMRSNAREFRRDGFASVGVATSFPDDTGNFFDAGTVQVFAPTGAAVPIPLPAAAWAAAPMLAVVGLLCRRWGGGRRVFT